MLAYPGGASVCLNQVQAYPSRSESILEPGASVLRLQSTHRPPKPDDFDILGGENSGGRFAWVPRGRGGDRWAGRWMPARPALRLRWGGSCAGELLLV